MARPNFRPSINRRSLITAAAAATAAGIVPIAGPGNANLVRIVEALAPPSFMPEYGLRHMCAATARRIREIERRNEVRREAGRPILTIPKELRRMWRQAELQAFERFEAANGAAVWKQVLKPRQEAAANPNWRPTWMEAVHYQREVSKILREQFRVARRSLEVASRSVVN